MTEFEHLCSLLRPYINSKRRNAVLWISKFYQYKDQGGRDNACLALGRLVGAIELIDNMARSSPTKPPLPDDFKAIINEAFEIVWPALNGGDPLTIPESWRILTPV